MEGKSSIIHLELEMLFVIKGISLASESLGIPGISRIVLTVLLFNNEIQSSSSLKTKKNYTTR